VVRCDSLVHLSKLDHLQFYKMRILYCEDLVEIGTLPTTLTVLNLNSCCGLRKIGGLSDLKKLQHLNISNCVKLEELSSLETLMFLEVINSFRCDNFNCI